MLFHNIENHIDLGRFNDNKLHIFCYLNHLLFFVRYQCLQCDAVLHNKTAIKVPVRHFFYLLTFTGYRYLIFFLIDRLTWPTLTMRRCHLCASTAPIPSLRSTCWTITPGTYSHICTGTVLLVIYVWFRLVLNATD
jgi:hypothetical protein